MSESRSECMKRAKGCNEAPEPNQGLTSDIAKLGCQIEVQGNDIFRLKFGWKQETRDERPLGTRSEPQVRSVDWL